jgi:dienelactone hydrolase
VLPTSWGLPQVQYLAQAQKLADSGYVVVSYNVRGFWQSGGEIEVAGPKDVADASKVIDWALANTPSDAGHIGMAGVSYGAGISLLAAAHDKRDQGSCLAQRLGRPDRLDLLGPHPALPGAALLDGAGLVTGRPSAELQQVFKDFFASDLVQGAGADRLGEETFPRDLRRPAQQERRGDHARQRLGRHDLPAQPNTPTSTSS